MKNNINNNRKRGEKEMDLIIKDYNAIEIYMKIVNEICNTIHSLREEFGERINNVDIQLIRTCDVPKYFYNRRKSEMEKIDSPTFMKYINQIMNKTVDPVAFTFHDGFCYPNGKLDIVIIITFEKIIELMSVYLINIKGLIKYLKNVIRHEVGYAIHFNTLFEECNHDYKKFNQELNDIYNIDITSRKELSLGSIKGIHDNEFTKRYHSFLFERLADENVGLTYKDFIIE